MSEFLALFGKDCFP